jgi:hypothetical protein
MKDSKNTPPASETLPARPGIPRLKDGAICIGWIGGLVLAGGLCWFLSQPLRSNRLMRAVNRVFIQTGDSRRLTEAIPPSELKPEALRMGTWYVMSFSGEGNRAVVFNFIGEGNFFPCVAEINSEGRVEEIIPLSSHGERIFRRLSPGSVQIYKRRIEGKKIERKEGGIP